ncbi:MULTISPECIES: ABC transporter substrate-binding protein [Brachybacterium]|uniref:Amino acid-binding protein n=1 Tax=Brachybacterium alimentarium TaxID=47845 RepID=A0A2A3YH15_9MICO|nr:MULTISPECIES: ABC transporter substrate-binding protein [Brachybacterium]PCC30979.1 amino acid-binding protein [Brachybacterium alimentarium]PCC38558.1 amino acid-binding protein [Brachybacterium alimentarium]RCS59973.1 ABC transporter substrate-binding protein [Brachybacterium sp. JB7]RCS65273.1 ABC transporter substrate-binding protein [Brachybacterium alimentarium]RCS81933.1 ABC transporter substrate-binding protein [Brachybacterium alimentarium]
MTSPRPRRRTLLRALPLALGGAALTPALAACTDASVRLDADSNAIPVVDFDAIQEQSDIAALVPEEIRERGELVNGAALNYAPGEFLGSDGVAVGYDIDILAAVGKVLGLTTRTESAVFAQIIPSIGAKYDVGISSFTINPERLEQVSMVSYFAAGMSYAVKTGNPYGITPPDLCGTRVAHQVGTYMDDVVVERDQECRDAGGQGIVDQPYVGNADAATAVAGGKADVLIGDSPVVAYAVDRSRGTLEEVGDIEDAALNGLVVAKDQPELAEAIRAAVQHLIDSGALREILAAWGNENGMIETSEVDPQQ